MLIKHIPTRTGGKRAGGGAVFRRVGDYIENKPMQERGRTLAADCVLDPRSAAMEMEMAALQAPRCKQPAMHIVLAWQPREHPTEQQQRQAVEQLLKNLRDRDGRDMTAHQWVAVLHQDTDQEHLHLLLNRVHPETGRAVSPEWSHRSMDKAGREIEAAQGWSQTPGLMTWSEELSRAVPTPANVRAEQQGRAIPAPAAAMEAHSYSESLYGFIKSAGIEKELRQIVGRDGATWAEVQYSLGLHGLELRRADRGGYIITNGSQQAKASEAARSIFSGRENRERLDRLGEWVAGDRGLAAVTYSPHREPQLEEREQQRVEQQPDQPKQPAALNQEQNAAPYRREDPAAQEQREQRKRERERARVELRARYEAERRAWAERKPGPSREAVSNYFKQINEQLKAERAYIRATTPRGSAREAQLSVAAFQAIERRDHLRAELAAERQAARPPTWQAWVEQKAQAGDQAAQAQMRGWQYAAQRVNPEQRARMEAADARQPTANEGVTSGVEWRRRWFLGGVEYKIDGRAVLIDKGKNIKLIDGKRSDDRTLALSMALNAEKRGGNVKATGPADFRARCADVAADRGLRVRFDAAATQARFEARRAGLIHKGVTSGLEVRRRIFLGGVEYKIDGRPVIIHKGKHFKVIDGERADDRTLALAMALSAEKRAGVVVMNGTHDFRTRCADIAAERGMRLRFDDPATQARFQAGQAEVRQQKDSQRQAQYERRQAEPRQAIKPDKAQQAKQTQTRRPSVQAVVARERQQQKQGRGFSSGRG